MLFENIECLTNTYKSGNLSGKLPKRKKCVYIYIYIMGNVNECRTALVKNLIKESFYGKRKKKQLMF